MWLVLPARLQIREPLAQQGWELLVQRAKQALAQPAPRALLGPKGCLVISARPAPLAVTVQLLIPVRRVTLGQQVIRVLLVRIRR